VKVITELSMNTKKSNLEHLVCAARRDKKEDLYNRIKKARTDVNCGCKPPAS
jgi:hypothetical protein